MRKTFEMQPELFVVSTEMDHPGLHGLARNSKLPRQSQYGYSVHTGVDEDGFIHSQTAGNIKKAAKFLLLYSLPELAITG